MGVREAALGFLARRAHTRAELRRKLLRKKFDREDVEACLDRFVERGLLDDRATAAALAASRSRAGRGRSRIAAELAAKGIPRRDAEAALAGLDPAEEASALRRAFEKRARVLPAGLTRQARSKKLFDHLVRRGFAPSAVLEALRTKGEPTDDDL
ncbi:MAG: regulatory protein RecX [Acidobacteriota bacterium]